MATKRFVVRWPKKMGRYATETNYSNRLVVSVGSDRFTSCAVPVWVTLFQVKCNEHGMLVRQNDWHGRANG